MSCPMCDGTPMLLGKLGRLMWYTCRHCGWQWNVDTGARKERREAAKVRKRERDMADRINKTSDDYFKSCTRPHERS